VAGRIWVDGVETPLLPGGLYGQHYFDGLDGWPEWLAAEARLHDPDAPAVVPSVGGAALRDRIAHALEREDALHWGYDHGFADSYGTDAETDGFVDAVLAVLPAPADRAAVLTEAADDDGEAEKLAKARRMAKALSAPPVAPAEWATTTEWPGRHKRPGDRRVHATARFVVNDTQRIWTACKEHVGRGGTALSHMPVDCRACKRAIDNAPRRLAGEAAPDNTETPAVVYRSPGGHYLYCTRHTDDVGDSWTPLASDDLPDGGLCSQCGADVLIPQQPKEG